MRDRMRVSRPPARTTTASIGCAESVGSSGLTFGTPPRAWGQHYDTTRKTRARGVDSPVSASRRANHALQRCAGDRAVRGGATSVGTGAIDCTIRRRARPLVTEGSLRAALAGSRGRSRLVTPSGGGAGGRCVRDRLPAESVRTVRSGIGRAQQRWRATQLAHAAAPPDAGPPARCSWCELRRCRWRRPPPPGACAGRRRSVDAALAGRRC